MAHIILFIYLIYFIWIIEPFFKKREKKKIKGDYPFVSIIISAKNEAENITNLLNGLLTQEYPKNSYEIIIANDKSTDSTLNKLNTFKHWHCMAGIETLYINNIGNIYRATCKQGGVLGNVETGFQYL